MAKITHECLLEVPVQVSVVVEMEEGAGQVTIHEKALKTFLADPKTFIKETGEQLDGAIKIRSRRVAKG